MTMPSFEEVISKPLAFEWDKGNIDKNLLKHGITNEESEQVFVNLPLILKDVRHSTKKESRYHCLGETDLKKPLFISFTIRNAKIRIISARIMNTEERRIYEQKTT